MSNSPSLPSAPPPWRTALDLALNETASDPASRFLSLATIGLDGYPSNRTLVFRGFLDDTNDLLLATDARSQKISEILRNQNCEACWYFAARRLQFRVRGKLQVIDGSNRAMGQVRIDMWRELSEAARHQFAWPAPGAERTGKPTTATNITISELTPLPPFFVLALQPSRVDVLNINFEPHRRVVHERAGETWKSTHINP